MLYFILFLKVVNIPIGYLMYTEQTKPCIFRSNLKDGTSSLIQVYYSKIIAKCKKAQWEHGEAQ